ncbi:MAG: leucine-rich repeat protein [Bacteroidales bacterium]|nr:leucine-rich repeat protein [Bacteroidales bacterium]
MKKLFLFIAFVLISISLFSEVSKTVNITAGGLASALTPEERGTITDLTITGTVDARDFKTMRDSMEVIAVVNMEDATIVGYKGSLGTGNSYTTYPENGIPDMAFAPSKMKLSLKSFIFPTSITWIGDRAFLNCLGLTSLIIPSQVTTIGPYSFGGCKGLTSISIPGSVTSIDETSFVQASGDVSVSDSNLNYLSEGGVLFNKDKTVLIHCPSSKIGGYVIPSTVTSLSAYSFTSCLYLTSISIPSSVTSIGKQAFYSCQNLASISLPPNITAIEEHTFTMCHKLTSIVVPSKVTSIGESAFNTCSKLLSITIPSTVTKIETNAFSYCTVLKSLYVETPKPIDLTSYVDVFKGIDKTTCILHVPYLTKENFNISNQWKDFKNIQEMDGFYLPVNRSDLFSDEGSRDTLSILSSVDWSLVKDQEWLHVNKYSGTGDDSLIFTVDANPDYTDRVATVTISSTNLPSQTINITQYGIPRTFNISAGGLSSTLNADEKNTISNLKLTGTMDARDFKTMRDSMPALSNVDISGITIATYSGTLGTASASSKTYFSNIVPDYSFCVPGTLKGKTKLNSVILPISISSIGNYAFYGCSNLIRFPINSSVTKIGDYAFYGCSSLNTVNLPPSVTIIGKYSFYDCTGLLSVENNSLVTSIGDYAFYNCTGLKSFFLPTSLRTLGNNSFNNCKKLASITIPSQVTSLGNSVFNGCCHLKSATLLSSISYLSNSLFYGCSDLTNFSIPSTVTSIKGNAFSYCSSLNNITIPSSVTTIEYYAFSYCTSFTSIEIPSSVTSLGSAAFMNCTNLNSVSLPSTINLIDYYTFKECINLISITIPSSVTKIGMGAFSGCDKLTSITIPSSVTWIDENAFSSCDKLVSVSIPSTVQTIGNGAFYWCLSLPTLKLPKTLTRIGNLLFAWDGNLTTMTIPSTVQTIGNSAFYNCGKLNSLICERATPVDLTYNTDVFSGVNKTTCKLFVPNGSKSLYAAANKWKDFTNIYEIPQLSDTLIYLDNDEGSEDSIKIQTSSSWNIISDQSWFTINPSSSDGDQTMIFSASKNSLLVPRTAKAILYVSGVPMQTISIIQEAGVTSILENISIPDTIVANGMITCFNAYDTITVAGGTDSVLFRSGSTVDLIAGKSIRFLPGFHACEGSFAHAWITTDGSFCDGSEGSIVQNPQPEKSVDLNSNQKIVPIDNTKEVKVYPNPNNGIFTIELANFENRVDVYIFNSLGLKVYQLEATDQTNYTVNLPEIKRGIYFIKVIDGRSQFTKKIIVK